MYENLATKYRPQTLDEVLGQDTTKVTLANAVKLGRVGHSYVFFGPRGCGKTTIARILAKTLNCHKPKDGVPCGKCPSCVEIAESKSLDVIEIDAASNTQVEKVRSVIVEQAAFAPSRDKYKIYILDEVHMLSTGAFNALLKTVEEPPAHVVFVMATTESHKVPATILSRSQCFRFRPLTEAAMAERLKDICVTEKIKAEPEALRQIARAADGAMRDALTMLDRAASFGHGEVKAEVLNEFLGHPGPEVINSLAVALAKRDAAGIHAAFDKLNTEGHDPLAALRDLRNLLAEAFLSANNFSKDKSPINGLPEGLPAAALARLSRKVNVIIEEVKASDALSLAAEMALFTLTETPVDLEGMVRRLESLGASDGAHYAPPAQPAQKKNDAPLAAAPSYTAPASSNNPPRPAHPAPAAMAPAAASGDGPVPAAAWRKLLGMTSARKPALHNILLSAKLHPEGDSTVRLVLERKFHVDMVERVLPELEAMLAEAAGKPVKIIPAMPGAAQPAPAAPAAPAPQAASVPTATAPKTAVPPAPAAAEEPAEEETDPAGDDGAVVDEPPPQEAPEKPAPKKPGLATPVDVSSEPELKHLAKVFHGRISRVTKIK